MMRTGLRSRRAFLSIPAFLVTLAAVAQAAPKVGQDVPDGRVEDVDGRELKLASLRGQTVVVVYEHKDAGQLNEAFKADLAKLPAGAAFVAPVADVSDYDSWPAKGFAKDAIRAASKKAGVTIWCDWKGSFREALHLPKGSSSVIVIGKTGKVLFAVDGQLDAAQRARAIARIEGDASSG